MLMHHCLAAACPRSKLEDWSNMTDSLQDIVALQDQAAFSALVCTPQNSYSVSRTAATALC